MALFYLINGIIGAYFLLTTLALTSKTALATCEKFYQLTERSIEKSRKTWLIGAIMVTGYYCYLWSTTFN